MSSNSVYHWLAQRVTAFILLPFSMWFLFRFLGLISTISKSITSSNLSFFNLHNIDLIVLLCFFICAFYHAVLGMQVILEDYVHSVVLRSSIFIFIKTVVILTILFLTFIVFYILLNY
ncbi:succinate dehydrogenase, hydrophobic membrane anchor protein [Ehrlichia sp. JZT12]